MAAKAVKNRWRLKLDKRSDHAKQYRKLYRTARWKRVRADQLTRHPLCQMCAAQGRVTAATVCDHINPNDKMDPELFFTGPKQSLCDAAPWRCHSSRKQRDERRQEAGKLPIQAVGADGWPVV